MIVKIQVSVFTTSDKKLMLVYNQAKDFFFQGPINPSVRKAIRNRPKAYFNIQIMDGEIKILNEAPWQNW